MAWPTPSRSILLQISSPLRHITCGKLVTEEDPYSQAATIARSESVEWGGDWKKFVDRPHYQLKINVTLAQLRSEFEQPKGGALFA